MQQQLEIQNGVYILLMKIDMFLSIDLRCRERDFLKRLHECLERDGKVMKNRPN